MKFSELMEEYRVENNQTYDSMAKVFKTTKTTIANWCKGITAPDIKPKVIKRIAEKTGKSEDIVVQAILQQSGFKDLTVNQIKCQNAETLRQETTIHKLESTIDDILIGIDNFVKNQKVTQKEIEEEFLEKAIDNEERQKQIAKYSDEYSYYTGGIYFLSVFLENLVKNDFKSDFLDISLTEDTWELGTDFTGEEDLIMHDGRAYIDIHYTLKVPAFFTVKDILFLLTQSERLFWREYETGKYHNIINKKTTCYFRSIKPIAETLESGTRSYDAVIRDFEIFEMHRNENENLYNTNTKRIGKTDYPTCHQPSVTIDTRENIINILEAVCLYFDKASGYYSMLLSMNAIGCIPSSFPPCDVIKFNDNIQKLLRFAEDECYSFIDNEQFKAMWEEKYIKPFEMFKKNFDESISS